MLPAWRRTTRQRVAGRSAAICWRPAARVSSAVDKASVSVAGSTTGGQQGGFGGLAGAEITWPYDLPPLWKERPQTAETESDAL